MYVACEFASYERKDLDNFPLLIFLLFMLVD